MTMPSSNKRCGAVSVDHHQAEAAPDPKPRRDPTSATRDGSASWGTRTMQSRTTGQKTLRILQWNAEGIQNKKIELQKFLHMENIHILCAQETHLNPNIRFSVRGYEQYRMDRDGHKGGLLMLVKNNIAATETERRNDSSEHLTVKLLINKETIHITNFYCPSNKNLNLNTITTQTTNHIITGDFNSHSPSWGYDTLNARGEDTEDWMIENQIILINQPDDPPTFFSRAWRTSSTPDLAMATGDLHRKATRTVKEQLAGSDHRPILIEIEDTCITQENPKRTSWNYKKADWTTFRNIIEENLTQTIHSGKVREKAKAFTYEILKAAQKTIPRGWRKNYKPAWSKELEALHDEATIARDIMEDNPTDKNTIQHNKCQAAYKREKLKLTRNSWREKTASLNFEKDTTKLWKLARNLNEDASSFRGGQTVIEEKGKTYIGKQAANILAEGYAQESTNNVKKERRNEIKQKIKEERKRQEGSEEYNKDFTIGELNKAIRQLKKRKSPGPDGVTNEMIQHLGTKGKERFLEIMNQSWNEGVFPEEWKEAEIIPILKKGKPKNNKASYRPISLLSCLGKTFEKIVNNRLLIFLEKNNLIEECQSGFRKNRSTDDQIILLAQEIENAFQKKQKTLAVFFDLTKAFDKVWKDGLLHKLLKHGIRGKMFDWIEDYLCRRRGRVKLDGNKSKQVKLEEGVPQGGSLSPTLFLIFINDLPRQFCTNIHKTLHADDLAIWTSTETTPCATRRIQEAIQKVEHWAEEWGVEINTDKTVSTLFTLSTKENQYSLTLKNKTLPQDDTPKYLGIKFDKKLTWANHINETSKIATQKLSLMKKLAGTTWGADLNTLKQLYVGNVRSTLEYGLSAHSTAAKTNKDKLNQIQNSALRIMTGAMKSTPITSMEATTGLQSLDERREEKILKQTEKYKRLPEHPMNEKLKDLTQKRLKRTSFQHLSLQTTKKNPEALPQSNEEREILLPYENYQMEPNFTIQHTIPGIHNKTDHSETELRITTLEYLDTEYPSEKWNYVYTDGSAEDATRNGGSGIFIRYTDGQYTKMSIPTGQLSTNYRSEVQALLEASKIINNLSPSNKNYVFLTDCTSSLQALQRENKDILEQNTVERLNNLCRQNQIILQWIPSHCGILGNEVADKLAKDATKMEQPRHKLSYKENKTLIKNHCKNKWKKRTKSNYPHDPLLHLSRSQQTTIYRLRTGHCRLRAHMHRLKLAPTPQCTCGTGLQTPEHVLQTCPLLDKTRKDTWATQTTLCNKLWGSAEDLCRTVKFMEAAGLPV